MRHSNLESHLKHLDAPEAPPDLRARCLATIPTGVQIVRSAHTPAWRAKRFALAGGLLLATAVISAFWSTRPTSEEGQSISGSMALAQTVKEMRNVTTFHLINKTLNTDKDGLHSSDWSQAECWFDEERGAYSILTNTPYQTALLPAHYAKTIYMLSLTDGTSYERGDSHFVVEKDAKQWTKIKELFKGTLLGDIATTSENASKTEYVYLGSELKLKSTDVALWQGQQAKLFVFECQPPNTESYRNSPTLLRKIYVDEATNRVIATQELALFAGKTPELLEQMEVDYKTPDAALFDPTKIRQGATQVPRSDPYPHP